MSKQNPETFQIGDTVTWTSQAGGKSKTKTGKVVRVIESFQLPGFNLPEGCTIKPTGGHRGHESYLIQVGKSKRLYWPLVKYLEPVRAVFTEANKDERLFVGDWQQHTPIPDDDDPMLAGEGCGYDAVDVGDGSNPDL